MPVAVPLPFPVNQCTIAFKVEKHDAYPSALEYITGKVKHPKHGEVASISAVRIKRYLLRDRFHAILNEDDLELATFATVLFDKFGSIRPRFVEHEYFKGSGCWDKELSDGIILYITDITVHERVRGMGIGSWTFDQLLVFLKPKLITHPNGSQDSVPKYDWIFCYPLPNCRILRKPERLDSMPQYNNFFREIGFRRVGRTDYFCYAPKPSHRSRLLPASDDVHHSHYCLYYTNHPERLDGPETRDPVTDLVEILQDDRIASAIRRKYTEDPTFVFRHNTSGYTILHLAAKCGNAVAVRTLLELLAAGAGTSLLCDRDNAQGLTPLDLCIQAMERGRVRDELGEPMRVGAVWIRRSKFDGFDESYLMVEAMLRRAMGDAKVGGMSDGEYAGFYKWGCTCGKCLGGWLSPRMKVRLEDTAVITYDLMGEPLDYDWWEYATLEHANGDLALPHIPPHILTSGRGAGVSKTFYKGYRFLFVAIYQLLLSQPPIPPTPSAVSAKIAAAARNEWTAHDGAGFLEAKAVQFYLKKGGLIEYALDCILYDCSERAPRTGDGTFDGDKDGTSYAIFHECLKKQFGKEGEEERGEEGVSTLVDQEWIGLPTCANDLEFEVVRIRLGLGRGFPRGPYRHGTSMTEAGDEEETRHSDSEVDDDEDDDEESEEMDDDEEEDSEADNDDEEMVDHE